MKKLKIYLGVTLMLLAISITSYSQDDTRGYIVNVGDQVPNLTFEMIDGSQTSIKDLEGKVVLLQFTASWCGVCRKEMPHLEREVWQEHKDDNFILIGIDYKESEEKTTKFAADMGISYPMALDPDGSLFHTFAAQKAGVTRNVLIDQNGKIVFLTRLFDEAEFSEMKKQISELLNS